MELLNAYVDHESLVIFRRYPDGALKRESKPAQYISYHRMSEISTVLKHRLQSTSAVSSIKIEGEWMRIGWTDFLTRKNNVRNIADKNGRKSPLAAAGVTSYEGDVSPVRRFLVDHDVVIQKPRRAYLDIETDSRMTFKQMNAGEARVLCWSLVDDAGELVASDIMQEDTDEDERRVLRSLWKSLEDFDQVVAWNSRVARRMYDTFDFNVIYMRSRELYVKHPDYRRWLWMDYCKAFMKMNLQVAASGDEKQSYKLQDVGMAVVGKGKVDFDASKTWEAWAAGGERRELLLQYNIQDTILLAEIEKKVGYLALIQSIAEACGIFADSSGVDALTQIDTYLLRLGRKRGYRFATNYRDEEGQDQFKGAFVMRPKVKGVVRNVHVCDFARLYPSIIITWNMSPETKVKNAAVNGPIPEGCCRTPTTGVVFDTQAEGIFPHFLKEIAAKRKYWNDKKAASPPGTSEWQDADRMSNGYKVLMNSAYGVIGSLFGRYYDRDIAESVTQTGVYLIKQVNHYFDNMQS